MISEEYDKLSDEEIQIKLAEFDGYKVFFTTTEMCDRLVAQHEGTLKEKPIPDYLNDLNACHELEKELLKKYPMRYWGYCRRLRRIESVMYHATARQRCKAIVLTIA